MTTAEEIETTLRALRKDIDDAFAPGGSSEDFVPLALTKLQCAVLLALIDEALR